MSSALHRLGTHRRKGSRCSHSPTWAPACLPIRVAVWHHFLPLGRRGPWKSVNSGAALGAGKAEVTRLFRSGDHKAAIEEGPLVSTFGQG